MQSQIENHDDSIISQEAHVQQRKNSEVKTYNNPIDNLQQQSQEFDQSKIEQTELLEQSLETVAVTQPSWMQKSKQSGFKQQGKIFNSNQVIQLHDEAEGDRNLLNQTVYS